MLYVQFKEMHSELPSRPPVLPRNRLAFSSIQTTPGEMFNPRLTLARGKIRDIEPGLVLLLVLWLVMTFVHYFSLV